MALCTLRVKGFRPLLETLRMLSCKHTMQRGGMIHFLMKRVHWIVCWGYLPVLCPDCVEIPPPHLGIIDTYVIPCVALQDLLANAVHH